MSRGGLRYGIFVHDPEGDMGNGLIVGAFKTLNVARERADAIQKASPKRQDEWGDRDALECIILDLWPGSAGVASIARHVTR